MFLPYAMYKGHVVAMSAGWSFLLGVRNAGFGLHIHTHSYAHLLSLQTLLCAHYILMCIVTTASHTPLCKLLYFCTHYYPTRKHIVTCKSWMCSKIFACLHMGVIRVCNRLSGYSGYSDIRKNLSVRIVI